MERPERSHNGPYRQRQGERAAPQRGRIRSLVLVGGLATILLGLLALGAWPRWQALREAQAQAQAEKAPKVVFVVAMRASAETEVTLPASLHAFQEATLYARASGYVARLGADIGDPVRAGQVLAEIDVPELDRELQQAQATRAQVKAGMELARVTAERYAALINDDAVSPQEADEKRGIYEARRADFDAAEANLHRLEHLKAYRSVVAPFAGTVTARNVDVGALIQAGSASSSGWLFKLAQTETLRVHINVPQSELKQVQPGTSASLRIPELADHAFTAKVVRTSRAFDSASRTMLVELHVANPDGAILPGMYGQVRLKLASAQPHLIVPVTAIMVGGEGLRVATVDAQDVVHIKPVEVGRDLGKQVEVVNGLEDNERVINNPRDNLADGVKVRSVPQEDEAKPAASGTEKKA